MDRIKKLTLDMLGEFSTKTLRFSRQNKKYIMKTLDPFKFASMITADNISKNVFR